MQKTIETLNQVDMNTPEGTLLMQALQIRVELSVAQINTCLAEVNETVGQVNKKEFAPGGMLKKALAQTEREPSIFFNEKNQAAGQPKTNEEQPDVNTFVNKFNAQRYKGQELQGAWLMIDAATANELMLILNDAILVTEARQKHHRQKSIAMGLVINSAMA